MSGNPYYSSPPHRRLRRAALNRDGGRCTVPAALRRGRSSITSSRGRAASPGRALKIDNLHSLCPNARRTDQGTPRRPARPTLIRANLTLRNVVVDPALLYSLIRAADTKDHRDRGRSSRARHKACYGADRWFESISRQRGICKLSPLGREKVSFPAHRAVDRDVSRASREIAITGS